MLIRALTPKECSDVLARTNVGRLACAHDNQPYIVPISFYFDGTASLYSFATVGQKIHWMRENPRVCVEVDEIADRFQWTSVVLAGQYEELGDSEVDSGPRRRAVDFFQQRAQWWLPGAAKLTTDQGHDTPVVYRIRIVTISGRRTVQPAAHSD